MIKLQDLDLGDAETTDEIAVRLPPLHPRRPQPEVRGGRLAMRWRQNWADGRAFCVWVIEDESEL